MKTTLAEQVERIMKTYNNPKDYRALVKAIEGLIQTHIELRDSRSLKELASISCRELHEGEPPEQVVCAACFEAALERINGR